ncbi:glycosyltransferase family 2 protein [Bacteroides zoogleoformans]|uniref:glycosyltransferase family 2 protein n=1 Tax=Bacteroides zoogleoformans TaxID=28119 RepID=UPI00248EACD3|nr:glycosyltransferase family 2 protein [Bacteroides zoogleoformans]
MKMDQNNYPLISFGIPVYNAVDLIERTLLSALNQTYPNIEYLFVDDKGNSMDIVRRVVAGHPRGRAVHIIDQQRNRGIAVARNTILDHAQGVYLFTMDCDDVIVPECIEILYNQMQNHPVDFVAASFVRVDMNGKIYKGCRYEDTLVEGGTYPVARYRYGEGKELFVASWNKLYRLDFLKKHNIRCQPGHYNEDPWFTYQVILNARSCHLIPDCTLYYTYNPESVSGLSASRGYTEKIARQYVEIQQLKSNYIRPLTAETFYCNLLVDIMEMSLYHAYRISDSHLLPTALKKELIRQILSVHFAAPTRLHGGKRTAKYLFLRTFFSLPMTLKYGMVGLGKTLQVKKWIGRWARFKH